MTPPPPPPPPPPRSAPDATHDQVPDDKVLERVRALLAKAESTTFPDEADALTAKAQELMARHAIDLAMLAAVRHDPTSPVTRAVTITDPYASGKALLCEHVAAANRARTAFHGDEGYASVVGFAADVEATELLFTSLLVQASSELLAHGPQVDHRGRSRTRSFRAAFWVAYATRIGQRLTEAAQAAATEAATVHGIEVLPVLASREAQVQEAFDAAFPRIVTRSVRVSNGAGLHAGRQAADRADLGRQSRIGATRW